MSPRAGLLRYVLRLDLRVQGHAREAAAPEDPLFGTRLFVCAKNWVLGCSRSPNAHEGPCSGWLSPFDRFTIIEPPLRSIKKIQHSVRSPECQSANVSRSVLVFPGFGRRERAGNRANPAVAATPWSTCSFRRRLRSSRACTFSARHLLLFP